MLGTLFNAFVLTPLIAYLVLLMWSNRVIAKKFTETKNKEQFRNHYNKELSFQFTPLILVAALYELAFSKEFSSSLSNVIVVLQFVAILPMSF